MGSLRHHHAWLCSQVWGQSRGEGGAPFPGTAQRTEQFSLRISCVPRASQMPAPAGIQHIQKNPEKPRVQGPVSWGFGRSRAHSPMTDSLLPLQSDSAAFPLTYCLSLTSAFYLYFS